MTIIHLVVTGQSGSRRMMQTGADPGGTYLIHDIMIDPISITGYNMLTALTLLKTGQYKIQIIW